MRKIRRGMILPLLLIVCAASFGWARSSGFSEDQDEYSSLSLSESCSSCSHSSLQSGQSLEASECIAEDDDGWRADRSLQPLSQRDPPEPSILVRPHNVWENLNRIVRSGVLSCLPCLSTDGRSPLLQTIGLHLPFFSPHLDGRTIMTASLDNFLTVFRVYREILPDEDGNDIVFHPSWFRYGGQALIYEFLGRDHNWPSGVLHLLPRQFWQGMQNLEPEEQEKLCEIIPLRIMDLLPKRMRQHVPTSCVQAVNARRRVGDYGTFD